MPSVSGFSLFIKRFISLNLQNMAAKAVNSGLEKLQEILDGSLAGQTVADLVKNTKDTKDYHDPKNRITTDYCVKQWNTDMLTPKVTT
jgi:hypothetical protein